MTQFSNLTVDYRQMLGVTIQDRVQLARSPVANEIFGNMTPTEIAKLFPTYYQKNDSSVQSILGATSGFNTASKTPGAPSNGSGGSGGGQSVSKPKTPETVAELIARAASVKKGGDPGQYGVLGKAVNTSLTPRQKALLDAIGTDSGGGYGTINYVAAANAGKETQDFSQHPFEGQKGYTAAGRYQILASNYENFAKKLGLYNEETKKSDFSPAAQDLVAYEMAKDVYRVGTGGRNLDEDIKNNAVDADSLIRPLSIDYGWHILKTESGMQRAVSVFNENVKYYEEQEKEKEESDYKQENLDKAPTAEPILQITPENITNVHGLDPRLIDYANTLQGAEKTKFFNDLNSIGDINEINQKSKTGLDRFSYSPQGKAVNVGDAVNQDPIAFWQERNPNGARIEDIDFESLKTAMMAAIKMEADHAAKGTPKKVEFYGPGAGVRTNPNLSESKHGLNYKEAIDFAIYDVDPETGQKMPNQSGAYGNYSNKPNHGGVDADGFALYHELKQNQELARIHMAANEGNMDYQNWGVRDGMLFSDVEWDAMHSDRSAGVNSIGVSDHTSPIGRGSVAEGLSLSALQELGIDPNSDAGQKLMTGVTERFGDTPEKLAESARKAYAPQPLAGDNPHIKQLNDGALTDYGVENIIDNPVPAPTAEATPVATETAPAPEPQTATPAPETPNDVPKLAQGGFIPQKDDLQVTDTKTGETVAMINDGEVEKGIVPKGGGVEVQSNEKVNAKELASKYEEEPDDTPEPTPQPNQSQIVQQGAMTAPVSESKSHQNIGHIPYQSTMDLVHNSLLRAYDLDRRRTGYGNIQ